jgi:hypothetical protein
MAYNINLQQCSDFYGLLFGMWCANRRSKKIRNGELCIEKPIRIIKKLLDDGLEIAQQNLTPRSVSRKQ